jgi:formylglycine-generating enzyme required for sulfatase activity
MWTQWPLLVVLVWGQQAAPVAQGAAEPDAYDACSDALEGMSCVLGGPFVRGHDARDEDARPAATVTLDTYYIDVYEVTNAEYRACVKAKKCNEAGPRYRGYSGKRQPITGVSWHDAKRYCEAHGKSLPTEAQWEKAARGPDGELNPWGDEEATCERAIIKDETGRSCGVKKPGSKPEAGRIFEVGQRPAGRYGLYDMIGNAEEWVADWYSPSYEACGEACAGHDPKGPCGGADRCKGHRKRVLKGGSWYWGADKATGIHRRANVPSNRPYHHFGFRCAASVAQAEALMKGAAAD